MASLCDTMRKYVATFRIQLPSADATETELTP
jgi:hypothetical protein